MPQLDHSTQRELLDLLAPLLDREDDRRPLLDFALGTDCPALECINWSGRRETFILHLVGELARFGEVAPGTQALWKLLQATRERVGLDRQVRIDTLESTINRPNEPRSRTADLAPGRIAAAGPVVFVSYSRLDSAFADRLVADLERAGHACWLDTNDIPGGEVWLAAIADGIERAYAFLTLVTQAANHSEWVRLEFLHAMKQQKYVIPLLAGNEDPPWYMADRQSISLRPDDYGAGLAQLLGSLPSPPVAGPSRTARTDGRQAELSYLRHLQLGELVHTELYTPMAGVAPVAAHGRLAVRVPSVAMHPEYQYLRGQANRNDPAPGESRPYQDIVDAFAAVRRAVLLGEPGAGKTTTLWKIARNAVDAAIADATAPVPLLVRLGKWTDADEALYPFLERQLGKLGPHVDRLVQAGRAVLLLDGLNEVPAREREAKARQVNSFLGDHTGLSAIVSCRTLDYRAGVVLDLDTITIRPLDPPRVRDFVIAHLTATVTSTESNPARRAALGRQRGEDLFWRLAGGQLIRELWQAWELPDSELALFWSATALPEKVEQRLGRQASEHRDVWRWIVDDPRSLMRLAGNPYLLFMFTQVYLWSGDIPANRAKLFDDFVDVLLLREKMAVAASDGATIQLTHEGEDLTAALEALAWALQASGASANDERSEDATDAATAMQREEAAKLLAGRLLYDASAASLLGVGEREVWFTHQLLQEYFAARAMRTRLMRHELEARRFWPAERWWNRTGWEEATVLLTGLHDPDATPIIEWLADAQPEVAAQCVLQSGARIPDETLERLRERWLPRLTDLAHDPQPEAREAVGRALGSLRLRGEPLDNRHGVSVRLDPRLGRVIPDIDWVEVPAGPFKYLLRYQIPAGPGPLQYLLQAQDAALPISLTLPTFFIARYPVTHCQFQCFIDDPEGFRDPRWWEGLAERCEQPAEPTWDYTNHPRETVSWFEAVAFARWLSHVLRHEIRLPTDQEWEKAAHGIDGRGFLLHENIGRPFFTDPADRDDVGQTSAVGIYPQSASPYGALDLAGNVCEWCVTKWDSLEDKTLAGDATRVVRGGSWSALRGCVRASDGYTYTLACRFDPYRSAAPPDSRDFDLGFRLVCVAPSG